MSPIEGSRYNIGIATRYGKPVGPEAEGYYYTMYKLAEGLGVLGHNVILMAHPQSIIPGGVEHFPATPTNAIFNGEILDWQYQLTDLASFFKSLKGYVDIFNAQTDHMSCFAAEFMSDPVMHSIVYAGFGEDVQNILRHFSHQNFSAQSAATLQTYPYLNWIGYSYSCIDTTKVPFVANPDNYLAYIGRISPDKGTHHAIEVAKQTGIPLVVVGAIQDDAYFEQYVKPHIDGSQVVYEGYLPKREVLPIVGNAIALVDTSVGPQNCPNTFLEAQACGTPVVAFRFDSAPEMVSEGETGFLSQTNNFEPPEFLQANISDLVQYVLAVQTLNRRTCREFVKEKFSPQAMIAAYLAMYEKVMKGR